MAMNQSVTPAELKPLRTRPAAIFGTVLLAGLVLPIVITNAEFAIYGLIAGIVSALVLAVWWLFFSRVPWPERLGAVVIAIAAAAATRPFIDASIAGAGMGMLFPMFSVQTISLALAAWALASRGWSTGLRRASLVASILIACAVFTLVRTGGIMGGAKSDLHWRWTPTPEQRLLARAEESKPLAPLPAPAAAPPAAPTAPAATTATTAQPTTPPSIAAAPNDESPPTVVNESPAEWPGFRGPDRNGVVRGVRIKTDWSTNPPVEMWRRPIGPGWSSFSVHGDLFYTQEQRGDDEIVAAYRVSTGEPVWRHRDPVRFYESNGGAGPRGTPTLSGGRAYAFGATGVLNALDERTGAVIWSRNAAADSKIEVPMWGFASSPLVINDEVIVAVEGKLAAYDLANGKPRWFGGVGGMSYSSPHRVTIDGVAQVVLLSGGVATSVSPSDGSVLWKYKWGTGAIVQPGVTPDNDILINSLDVTGGQGIRRLAISHSDGKTWKVDERWTSTGLKPYYNDFVVHKGHAFGFDGSILSCIDLNDGARKWKGGRYGQGQLVLLPDQDLLLVISEEGDVALVSATADQFKEIARFHVLEGKTWNHPVIVGNVLLVRNGEEMAAFRLALEER
jgi:outer membrane protein assembly factor BamB